MAILFIDYKTSSSEAMISFINIINDFWKYYISINELK